MSQMPMRLIKPFFGLICHECNLAEGETVSGDLVRDQVHPDCDQEPREFLAFRSHGRALSGAVEIGPHLFASAAEENARILRHAAGYGWLRSVKLSYVCVNTITRTDVDITCPCCGACRTISHGSGKSCAACHLRLMRLPGTRQPPDRSRNDKMHSLSP